MERGHCADCFYYTPFPDRPGWGYCHRYPPSGWKASSFTMSGEFLGKVALKSARTEELRPRYEGKIKGLWEQPQMEPQDWCGEYRAKAEADDAAGPATPAPAEG